MSMLIFFYRLPPQWIPEAKYRKVSYSLLYTYLNVYYANDPVLILASVIYETFKIKPPNALETKTYD